MKYKASKEVFRVHVPATGSVWGSIELAGGNADGSLQLVVKASSLIALGFEPGRTDVRLRRLPYPPIHGTCFAIHCGGPPSYCEYALVFAPNDVVRACATGLYEAARIRMKVGETRFYTLERVVE